MYYFTGKDLLVHPVTEEGVTSVTAYLPGKDEVRLHLLQLSGVKIAVFTVQHHLPLYSLAIKSVFSLLSGLV